jgi:hypothetical protein
MAQITTYFSSSGGGISGSGAAGEVAFFTAATVLDSGSNLAWDDTNRRLSINGPNTVGSTLVIAGDGNADATSAIDVRTSLLNNDITVFKVYDNGRIDSQVLSGTGSGGTDNVAMGMSAGANITTGLGNLLLGSYCGEDISSGSYNVAAGLSALKSNQTGNGNSAFGYFSLNNIGTTGGNTAVGFEAGRYRGATGTTANTNSQGGVYIGQVSRAGVSGASNEIVIGSTAVGAGSNTATIGNTSCTKLVVNGTIEPTNNLVLASGRSIFFSGAGGNIGTSAVQKLAFWGKAPVAQPDTSITPATISHIGGTTIGANDTFNGYTLAKVVAALQQVGILA